MNAEQFTLLRKYVLKLTQEDAAEVLGYSVRHIKNIEAGRRQIGNELRRKIEGAFNLPMDYSLHLAQIESAAAAIRLTSYND